MSKAQYLRRDASLTPTSPTSCSNPPHKAASSLVTLSSWAGSFDYPHHLGAFSTLISPRELGNQEIACLDKLTEFQNNMSPLRGISALFRSNRPRSKSDKQINKPAKTVFGDLATAHSSITATRSTSGFLGTPSRSRGNSQAARGFSVGEGVTERNPEDTLAMNQSLARNRSNQLSPEDGPPILLDEIGVKFPSLANSDSEWAKIRTPICVCYLKNETFYPLIENGEHSETCLMSAKHASPQVSLKSSKLVDANEAEPVAAITSARRVRRSASLSGLGRYSANYSESTYSGLGEAISGYDTAYDQSLPRGFATPNHENANDMLFKPYALGQYSHDSQQVYVPAGLGRTDLAEGFYEGRNLMGDDPTRMLKSSTVGSIVQKYSSGDMEENPHVYAAHDQRAEYKAFEDMTQYEAEAGEGELEDGRVGNDTVFRTCGEGVLSNFVPTNLAGLEDPKLMLEGHSSGLSQFAWSPPSSNDGHSVDDLETLPALAYHPPVPKMSPALPSPAPMDPLPLSPPLGFPRQAFLVTRDISTTTGDHSRSSGSYGNTRNLLELSSPQPPEFQLGARGASGRVSPQKSNMPKSAHRSRFEGAESSNKTASGLFNPSDGTRPAPARNISDRSFARISVLSSSGSIHSQPLSLLEVRTLEEEVATQLRRVSDIQPQSGHSSEFGLPDDNITCHARLSIEFSDSAGEVAETDGPGGSQSSSSHDHLSGTGSSMLDAPRFGHAGRLGSYHDGPMSSLHEGNLVPLTGRGRVTQNRSLWASLPGTDAAGTVDDAHICDDAQAEDDKDWETVAESRNFSRHGTQNTMAVGGTGSSLADYSDSGSLSPPKLAPLFSQRVLQHPPHPRYTPRSFRLLKNNQGGELVLMPEYTFTGGAGFPNHNALTPVMANRGLNNPYQHPTPLSREHAHPFKSSPPPMTSGHHVTCENGTVHVTQTGAQDEFNSVTLGSRNYVKEGTYQDHGLQTLSGGSEAGYTAIKDGQRDVSLSTFGPRGMDGSYQSSAWLSTQDEAASVDYSDLPGRGGSLSKMTVLGPQANLTGTLEGTGAREFGSSLADGSSPGMKFSSKPNHQFSCSPFVHFAPIEEHTSSTPKSAKSFHRRTIDGAAKSTGTTAPGDFYDRIRNHAIHRDSDLYDEDEADNLPQTSFHPTQIQKHRQHLIDHSLLPQSASSPSTDSRRFSAPLHLAESRENYDMEKVPGTTAYAGFGQPLASYTPSMPGTTPRMRSPHRRVPSQDDIFDAKNLISHNETALISPPLPTAQVGKPSKQNSKSCLLGRKTQQQKMEKSEAHPMQSLKAQSVEQQEGSSLNDVELTRKAEEVSTPEAPSLVRPTRPVRPQPHFRPDGRPIARAESPHLYRIPRATRQAVLQRQKELSIMVLCLCFLCPPMLIIYGHGFMDGVMEWFTRGQMNAFRPQEKKAALAIAYGGLAAMAIGIVAAMIYVAVA